MVVENHGGLSSNGKYLANVIEQVKLDNCGTLPDFGNFCLDGWPKSCLGKFYDKYLGVEELMPFAHAVSAKSYDFDEMGNEGLPVDGAHRREGASCRRRTRWRESWCRPRFRGSL